MAATLVLETNTERCEGSSPSPPTNFQGIAQPGRVLGLEPSCRWFESIYPDQALA